MATVLIVDDEAPQRAKIDRALTEAGHQVDSAAGGNQALARLKEKRYDLLVTDLMMDQGTGFEVLEWVRENAPGLPVIVCSSYAKAETLKTLLTTQLFRTVRKPFQSEDLVLQVRELLGDVA
jgi:DNA-binding NtrC family response regulator